jgi:hypothetical protein
VSKKKKKTDPNEIAVDIYFAKNTVPIAWLCLAQEVRNVVNGLEYVILAFTQKSDLS